jgi:hypothetical protein
MRAWASGGEGAAPPGRSHMWYSTRHAQVTQLGRKLHNLEGKCDTWEGKLHNLEGKCDTWEGKLHNLGGQV